MIAPAYARLLYEASRRLGSVTAYYALFPPSSGLAEPWASLAAAVYCACAPLPILFVPSPQPPPGDAARAAAAGEPVDPARARGLAPTAPAKAVLPDPSPTPHTGAVVSALLEEQMPLAADTPGWVVEGFLASAPGVRVLSPEAARGFLRSRPAAAKGAAATRPLERTLVLLAFCLSDIVDCDADSCAQLAGVPLAPVAGGAVVPFARRGAGGAPTVFVCRDLEVALLERAPGALIISSASCGEAPAEAGGEAGGEGRVEPPASLRAAAAAAAAIAGGPGAPPLFQRMWGIAEGRALNLSIVNDQALGLLVAALFPAEWARARDPVVWTPGANGHPSAELVARLWRRLSAAESLAALADWPVLPALTATKTHENDNSRRLLLRFQHAAASAALRPLPAWSDADDALGRCLRHLGVRQLDPDIVPDPCPPLGTLVGPPDGPRVLAAIRAALGAPPPHAPSFGTQLLALAEPRLAAAPGDCRRALRAFLVESKWSRFGPEDALTLAHLPIFQTFPPVGGAERFVALAPSGPSGGAGDWGGGGGEAALLLPPLGVDPALLSERFLLAASQREGSFLEQQLGVARMPVGDFLRTQVRAGGSACAPLVSELSSAAPCGGLSEPSLEINGLPLTHPANPTAPLDRCSSARRSSPPPSATPRA